MDVQAIRKDFANHAAPKIRARVGSDSMEVEKSIISKVHHLPWLLRIPEGNNSYECFRLSELNRRMIIPQVSDI
jgi:hypothetical protein